MIKEPVKNPALFCLINKLSGAEPELNRYDHYSRSFKSLVYQFHHPGDWALL
jgi:hypothetical protein